MCLVVGNFMCVLCPVGENTDMASCLRWEFLPSLHSVPVLRFVAICKVQIRKIPSLHYVSILHAKESVPEISSRHMIHLLLFVRSTNVSRATYYHSRAMSMQYMSNQEWTVSKMWFPFKGMCTAPLPHCHPQDGMQEPYNLYTACIGPWGMCYAQTVTHITICGKGFCSHLYPLHPRVRSP